MKSGKIHSYPWMTCNWLSIGGRNSCIVFLENSPLRASYKIRRPYGFVFKLGNLINIASVVNNAIKLVKHCD